MKIYSAFLNLNVGERKLHRVCVETAVVKFFTVVKKKLLSTNISRTRLPRVPQLYYLSAFAAL
jgi:hypothetical protein